MTTLIPTLAQCPFCAALLLPHEMGRDEEMGLVCGDAGACAARARAVTPPPVPVVAAPAAQWEASAARRQRERLQRRAERRGRAA